VGTSRSRSSWASEAGEINGALLFTVRYAFQPIAISDVLH
jgi:hypothetical protein